MKIGKYEIVYENKKRYYVEDLKKRDYSLENTTPYLLSIDGYDIKESSWGELLRNMAAFLIEKNPKYKDKLFAYRTKWSNKEVFSCVQRTNFKQIDNELYINCNHTALHSCWLVQDLLKFFKVKLEDVKFLIHRPCATEPDEVKDYVLEKTKKEFSIYLANVEELNRDEIDVVMDRIEITANLELEEFSKSYDNFFLFDDINVLSNYVSKYIKRIKKSIEYDDDTKNSLIYCVTCLLEFFKV